MEGVSVVEREVDGESGRGFGVDGGRENENGRRGFTLRFDFFFVLLESIREDSDRMPGRDVSTFWPSARFTARERADGHGFSGTVRRGGCEATGESGADRGRETGKRVFFNRFSRGDT